VRAAWADGLALGRESGSYDRILVHALIEPPAPGLTDLLVVNGALVAIVADDSSGEQRILRLTRQADGDVTAEMHGTARTFMPLAEGLARAL
jgi:protein-L-isoaspartate O-methyltransferase